MTGAGAPAVACAGLTVSYGEVRALDGVSFEIAPGELFGLLGPNGAGKTTTLKVLTTLLTPAAGEARVFGLDVRSRAMAVRRLLGYVPQQLSADSGLTAYENVWLFARLFDVPRAVRGERIHEVLDWMGLSEASDRLVSTYS
ncbi:MAG: ATP-binding cassette domain-containing protein, partial [Candidatus Dormibacteria bacterium]